MNEPTKFCKDCRFLLKGWLTEIRFAKCGHPTAVRFENSYLVSAATPGRHYCSSMREDKDRCGQGAKLWEPRW